MERLLLLSCSKRKNTSRVGMPALTRYDGPFFRILRHFLREKSNISPQIFILSAEYGLISPHEEIDFYDRRMTEERALELQEQVQSTFSTFCKKGDFTELFVCMGKDYEVALKNCWKLIPNTTTTYFAQGSIGGRGSQLRSWLWKNQLPSNNQTKKIKRKYPISINGIPIKFTKQQIIDTAIRNYHAIDASRYQTWFVPIGEKRIAVKWLVSQISGLPVSEFNTDDAIRILKNYNIKVERNER